MAENKKLMHDPVLAEAISIRTDDGLVITISADPDGPFSGKLNNEVLKYCADVILSTTDVESLENMIDVPLALQETLEKDLGWPPNKVFDFIRKWKRRVYLMQIGEYDQEDRIEAIKQENIRRAEAKKEEEMSVLSPDLQIEKDENNVVTVKAPKDEEDREEFSIIDKEFEANSVIRTLVNDSKDIDKIEENEEEEPKQEEGKDE